MLPGRHMDVQRTKVTEPFSPFPPFQILFSFTLPSPIASLPSSNGHNKPCNKIILLPQGLHHIEYCKSLLYFDQGG